jgi:hypothetical protein
MMNKPEAIDFEVNPFAQGAIVETQQTKKTKCVPERNVDSVDPLTLIVIWNCGL